MTNGCANGISRELALSFVFVLSKARLVYGMDGDHG